MKTTVDIPDELYRRVKAKGAMEGKAIRQIAIEMLSRYLAAEPAPAQAPQRAEGDPPWFGLARAYASKVTRHDIATIRASIAAGRAGEMAEPTLEDASDGTLK